MKVKEFQFPYPVLGIGDTIIGELERPAPEIVMDQFDYIVKIHLGIDNREIERLINNGLAEFVCEVSCSATLFRNVYSSSNGDFSFTLTRRQLRGVVEISCYVLAKEKIVRYRNPNFTEEFSGYYFDLDPGEPLAFFYNYEFNADIQYDKLKSVSNFLEITVNEAEDFIYPVTNLEGNKIEIQLSKNDYKIFSKDVIAKNRNLSAIFHSSLVLSALIYALSCIQNHKEKLWAQAITYRIDTEKDKFDTLSLEEPSNIPDIAQRLLGNPISRLLAALDEQMTNNEEEE